MRHAPVVARASVALIVVVSVAGCAATSASPSPRASTPASTVAEAATSSPTLVPSPSPSPTTAPSPAASAQADPRISRIRVGDAVEPRWFAADGHSLWVHEPTSLVRVDLATLAITGSVPMDPIDYGYVASGAGAVWETDFDRNTVVRIDPVADRVVARITVGSAPDGVAVTADGVWVGNHHDGTVTRIDPVTNRVVATIRAGSAGQDGPQTMTAGPGGIWVDVPNAGEVVRIDAATNRVGLRVPLDGPVASDGIEVWIGGPNGLSEVDRIDPVSGKVITTVDLGGAAVGDLAVGLGFVWVSTDGGLFQIDPATGRIVGRLELNGDGGDVTVAGGAVWVSAEGRPYVLRVAPH